MAVVPYNLRFALADSRRNVGLHALTWPIIFLLNLDGTIALNDESDHLGYVQSVVLYLVYIFWMFMNVMS